MSKGSVGEYQLQVAIAALHDQADRVEDTDWPESLALYRLLERMTGNPMVLPQPSHRQPLWSMGRPPGSRS
jgi:predicted RNA polymerase sigma factor